MSKDEGSNEYCYAWRLPGVHVGYVGSSGCSPTTRRLPVPEPGAAVEEPDELKDSQYHRFTTNPKYEAFRRCVSRTTGGTIAPTPIKAGDPVCTNSSPQPGVTPIGIGHPEVSDGA